MKNERINIALSKNVKERLQKVAEDNGLGMSEIVRRGLISEIKLLERDKNV